VSFFYNFNQTILEKIHLKISPNECVGIIGRNGVGKTTLIKLMNGLLKPKSGNVYVDGKNTKNEKISSLSKLVGIISQNPDHMLFSETVLDEIKFGLHNISYDKDNLDQKAIEISKKFNLFDYISKSPLKLSGGQKKMLSIASVYALNSKYLVLDEPTIGQDAKQKQIILNLIQEFKNKDKGIIIITHDLDWIAEIATRIIVLSDNEIFLDGSPEKILSNKKILELSHLFMPEIPTIARELNLTFKSFPKDIIKLNKLSNEILKLLGES